MAMLSKSAVYLLAGVFALGLVRPGWAADQTKEAPAKKMAKTEEHAGVRKGSEEIRKVQEALKAKGEDPGSIDGIMGKKTQVALKKFQEQNNLKATAMLDEHTAEKLGVQTAKPSTENKMKEEKK
jgi:peptidoglycan hydrolase-like protein with peptidoglycan-binding domain